MISPKSKAPSDIKLPDTPNIFIIMTAKSIDNGITEATISPARRLPRNNTRTKTTINAPSKRLISTVLMALFTILVLSRNGSIITPSGSVFSITLMRSLTSLMTFDEFSPLSIITIAPATSPLSLKHMAP